MQTKKFLIPLLLIGMLASCGPTNPSNESTTDPTISDPSTGTSEETSIQIDYVDLPTAIERTRNSYSLYAKGLINESLLESYSKDIYLNSMHRVGYIVLPSDPGFSHQFGIGSESDDNRIKQVIDVYGRVGDATLPSSYKDLNFFASLDEYVDQFVKVEENIWRISEATSLAYTLKDFFGDNNVKYADTFEITIGNDNCLEYLKCYETNGENFYESAKYKFYKTDELTDIPSVKDWFDKGAKVNERLVDYKFLYRKVMTGSPISVYYGEEVTFEGIVSAIDTDNNLYVGTFDNDYGYVNMKISGHGNDFEIQDKVRVTGTVDTANYTAFINDATIIDLGEKGEFLPVYDEESLVDVYGGGIYASQLFISNPPAFSSAVYSTYACVSSYDLENSAEENKISLVFPNQVDANDVQFAPELVLPANLSSDKKDEIRNYLKDITLYKKKTGGTEISIQNVIVEVDFSSMFGIRLVATEQTIISSKLSALEKIEKYVGLEDFPLIYDVETKAFTFGGFKGMILETYYNLDESNPTKGLYIGFNDIAPEVYGDYQKALVTYGYELLEEVIDYQGRRQSIYKLKDKDSYLAIAYANDGWSTPCVDMWIYEAEKPLLPVLIEEKLANVAPFFDINEFIRATGTYDADYLVFELDTYAGEVYSDEPLIAFTINSKVKSSADYARLLMTELGYKQYRVGSSPYQYYTRGQAHYVLQSPSGVFLDLACYPNTDYTYAGCKEFEYRIEVLVYKSENPISIKTYSDLSVLVKNYTDIHESLDYTLGLELPDDVVVEYWKDTGLKNIDFGYGCRDEAFIYSDDLETIWNNLKECAIANGWDISVDTSNRAALSYYIGSEGFYLSILYEPQKGYIRVMNDVLGYYFS